MGRNNYDDDRTEFYERDDDDYSNFRSRNDEDDDETKFDDFSSSDNDDFFDDSDETINMKRKKPDILGFIVVKKGRRKNDKFDLTKSDVIIGKSHKCCDIVFDDEDISKIHCRIRKDPDKNEFHFFDCGSTNGSEVNGQDTHHVVLKSHDKITLGENTGIVFVQV